MVDTTERRPRMMGVLDRIAEARRGDSSESLAAVFLLVATLLALGWANSPWGWTYDAFWHGRIAISVGGTGIDLDLQHWVNDGLMALFFFVIGLEVKRELAIGELRDRSQAAVPSPPRSPGWRSPRSCSCCSTPPGRRPRRGAWSSPPTPPSCSAPSR